MWAERELVLDNLCSRFYVKGFRKERSKGFFFCSKVAGNDLEPMLHITWVGVLQSEKVGDLH